MAHSYNRTLLRNAKKGNPDMHNGMVESQKHETERKKPDSKAYIL